jgi:hypothetical protein
MNGPPNNNEAAGDCAPDGFKKPPPTAFEDNE